MSSSAWDIYYDADMRWQEFRSFNRLNQEFVNWEIQRLLRVIRWQACKCALYESPGIPTCVALHRRANAAQLDAVPRADAQAENELQKEIIDQMPL